MNKQNVLIFKLPELFNILNELKNHLDFVIHLFTEKEKLLEFKKVNTPNPNDNEVLVKVLAAGMNNTEINTRLGWYSSSIKTGTDDLNNEIEEGSNNP